MLATIRSVVVTDMGARRALWLAIIVMGVTCGGCSPQVKAPQSWIDGVGKSEAQQIAADLGAFISDTLPPAKTALLMPKPGPVTDAVAAPLAERLRANGFAVVESSEGTAENIDPLEVAFFITPLEERILVRLTVGAVHAARTYTRGEEGLIAATPFTVRWEEIRDE